jgi:hypothetical protein
MATQAPLIPVQSAVAATPAAGPVIVTAVMPVPSYFIEQIVFALACFALIFFCILQLNVHYKMGTFLRFHFSPPAKSASMAESGVGNEIQRRSFIAKRNSILLAGAAAFVLLLQCVDLRGVNGYYPLSVRLALWGANALIFLTELLIYSRSILRILLSQVFGRASAPSVGTDYQEESCCTCTSNTLDRLQDYIESKWMILIPLIIGILVSIGMLSLTFLNDSRIYLGVWILLLTLLFLVPAISLSTLGYMSILRTQRQVELSLPEEALKRSRFVRKKIEVSIMVNVFLFVILIVGAYLNLIQTNALSASSNPTDYTFYWEGLPFLLSPAAWISFGWIPLKLVENKDYSMKKLTIVKSRNSESATSSKQRLVGSSSNEGYFNDSGTKNISQHHISQTSVSKMKL